MAHYSEMDFLFNNNNIINQQVNNKNNTINIFKENSYVVYKGHNSGTNEIKNYLKYGNDNKRTGIYKNENQNQNPYIKLLKDFNEQTGNDGAGLTIKAADLAYLRDLGVYPINRMAILRRFPEGSFVYENLEEMKIRPISTVIGWIKPDQNFGKIDFNETWTTTDKRFDVLLAEIIQRNFGIPVSTAVPIPDFAQGILFEFYKKAGLTNRSGVDENVEQYKPTDVSKSVGIEVSERETKWGLDGIPIGDPNVLQEGPFRNPEGQNIKSNFSFDLETTYEQKLLGDVDPGSAMLDIIDNLYAMGTSNMVFYWGDGSSAIQKAMKAATGKANDLTAWWVFVADIMKSFWEAMIEMLRSVAKEMKDFFQDVKEDIKNININKDSDDDKKVDEPSKTWETIKPLMKSILTSTISIHRFHLRGSIELMVGGKVSSTPWYLTIGNPYSPWLSTNHIIVKSASIETSNEMGFNDQPQWIKAKFTCEFSRSLGKQELMRMFNNTYRRTYSTPREESDFEQEEIIRQNKKMDSKKPVFISEINTKTLKF